MMKLLLSIKPLKSTKAHPQRLKVSISVGKIPAISLLVWCHPMEICNALLQGTKILQKISVLKIYQIKKQ
jgi:hypothetical protein